MELVIIAVFAGAFLLFAKLVPPDSEWRKKDK